MTNITIENFRCFGSEQSVPLAPLTLLVGENSTGKTSFMAMVRALWELAFDGMEPNFNRPPYELGSFDEIAHRDAITNTQGRFFRADCNLQSKIDDEDHTFAYKIDVEFREEAWMPDLKRLKVSNETTWIECHFESDKSPNVHCGVNDCVWELELSKMLLGLGGIRSNRVLSYFKNLEIFFILASSDYEKVSEQFRILQGPDARFQECLGLLHHLSSRTIPYSSINRRAYASAPVRSAPIRTHEVSRFVRDTEGRHVPQYLAHLYRHREEGWIKLKQSLETFGRASGLFDEICVRNLSPDRGSPFQIEVGWTGKHAKKANHNVTNVGYGVSQVLPVLTEVLRGNARHLLLFQQPEVHLHPRAQAALGSLFCGIAGADHHIVVETHSDYILDRVRMDIRDQECNLQHQDVAILFFERSGSNVKIHPINLDAAGNIVDPPPSYRQFFMQEIDRLIRY